MYNFKFRRALFIFILLNLAVSYIAGSILELFYPNAFVNPFIIEMGLVQEVFLSILIAPIFETLLFQTLIIEGFQRINKTNIKFLYLGAVISSIAFGFNHPYSIAYIIATTMSGATYAIAYIWLREHKWKMATIGVIIIHSVHNLAAFIESHLS